MDHKCGLLNENESIITKKLIVICIFNKYQIKTNNNLPVLNKMIASNEGTDRRSCLRELRDLGEGVLNSASYKISEFICINQPPTYKCVVEINRFHRNRVLTTIYKHYTLAQIYASVQGAIVDAEARRSSNETEIRDLFLFDDNTRGVVSIPRDSDMTLFEFIESHPSYLRPSYSVLNMSMIYKMYVIDNVYLNKSVAHAKPEESRSFIV